MTNENQIDKKNDPVYRVWKRVFKLVKNIAKVRSPKSDVHFAYGSMCELLSMISGHSEDICASAHINSDDGKFQFELMFANTPEYFETWIKNKYAKAIYSHSKVKMVLHFVVEPIYTSEYTKFLKSQKKEQNKQQKNLGKAV